MRVDVDVGAYVPAVGGGKRLILDVFSDSPLRSLLKLGLSLKTSLAGLASPAR